MPRETVAANDTFIVSVGWTRDHDAQVAIQMADPDRTIADLLFGGEGGYLGDIGLSLHQQLDGSDAISVEHVELGQMVLNALKNARHFVERDGLWATLSRREINEMIQSLRKARDIAYGKDA